MIFLSLRNRQIVAYPLTETARIPILTLDGHEEENVIDWENDPILLYANDQWLVSLSNKTMKQWDIASKKCVATRSLSCFYDLQMRQNRLFMRTYNSDNQQQDLLNLFIADLNQCNLNFTQYATMPNTNISIEERSVSYIETVFAETFENSDEEATELIEDQTRLQTIFFHSNACDFKLIDPEKSNGLSYVMTQNGLAVIVRHNDEKNQKPEMIEFFDIKTGVTLNRIQKHKMCEFGNNWPIKIFQGTILYMTEENQIVKITFPQSEKVKRSKRKLNSSSDALLAKKMKIRDNSSKG